MRAEKKSMVNEIRQMAEGKSFVILTDYRGLSSEMTGLLRSRLRAKSAEYGVVKNRLFRQVTGELGLKSLDRDLRGPTAIVTGDGDVVEVAKVLKAFIKENKLPVVKQGVFSGTPLTADEVDKLATMPPRIELLGRAVGTIAAPMTQLVGVMNQKVCSLLYVLQAAKDKKDNA